MPTIGVEKNEFLRRIKKSTETEKEELEHLFFDLGLELDDVVTEDDGKELEPHIKRPLFKI